jgi:hypothetical protein
MISRIALQLAQERCQALADEGEDFMAIVRELEKRFNTTINVISTPVRSSTGTESKCITLKEALKKKP